MKKVKTTYNLERKEYVVLYMSNVNVLDCRSGKKTELRGLMHGASRLDTGMCLMPSISGRKPMPTN